MVIGMKNEKKTLYYVGIHLCLHHCIKLYCVSWLDIILNLYNTFTDKKVYARVL